MGIADSIAELVKQEVGKQTATLVAQRELLLDVFTKATQTMMKAIDYIKTGDASKAAADTVVESQIDLPRPTIETPTIGTSTRSISRAAIASAEFVVKSGKPVTTKQFAKAFGFKGPKGREKASRWLQYAEQRGMLVRVQMGVYGPPDMKMPEWKRKALSESGAVKQGLAVVRLMHDKGLDGHSRDEVRKALVEHGYNGNMASAQTRIWFAKSLNFIAERNKTFYVTDEGLRLLVDGEAAGLRYDIAETRLSPLKRKHAAEAPASTQADS